MIAPSLIGCAGKWASANKPCSGTAYSSAVRFLARLDAPVREQIATSVDTDDRVGVANIDRRKHYAALYPRPPHG